MKLFQRSFILKVPGGPKSQKTLTDWPFSLLLSVFSSVDLEVGVRVCLREVSAYGRLEMSSFSREIAGKTIWCPFMGGVRSREVSVSGGSTVFQALSSVFTQKVASRMICKTKNPVRPFHRRKSDHAVTNRSHLQNSLLRRRTKNLALYNNDDQMGYECNIMVIFSAALW